LGAGKLCLRVPLGREESLSTTDAYELFDPAKPCGAVLPANTVRDEFTLVAFGALVQERPEGSGTVQFDPAVIPRDVVNSDLVHHLREEVFHGVPQDFWIKIVKGGFSLAPKWDEPIKSKLPPYADPKVVKQVTIRDVGKFLSEPAVKLNGEMHEVDLTRDNVRNLVEFGDATVLVGKGTKETLVRVKAAENHGAPAAGGGQSDVVKVDDLYGFLASRELAMGGERVRSVELTSDNVRDLTAGAVTRVEVGSGQHTTGVYVQAGGGFGASTPGAVGGTGMATNLATAPGVGTASYRVMMLDSSQTADRPASAKAVDDAISESYLPKFELVLYLPYRQTWELLGYSRGELLNSIPLAPQEETTIEIFSWDRRRTEQEDVRTAEQEGTLDVTFTDKDTLETLKEMAKTSDWKFNASGNVSVPIKAVKVGVGAGLNTSEEVKSLGRHTHQAISEATQKASQRVKTTRQTKVVESEEVGREEKVTRKLKNPNMCRSLTLDYFEVLGNYRLTQALALDEARLCVLTPTSLSDQVDRNFIICHEGVLKESILSRAYLRGFDAARELAARDEYCDVKCAAPCPCDAAQPVAPVASTEAGGAAAQQDPVEIAAEGVRGAVRALRSSIQALENTVPDEICKLANDLAAWFRYTGIDFIHPMSASEKKAYEDKWTDAKAAYHRWLYRKAAMEWLVPRFWSAAVDFRKDSDETPARLERLLLAADPQVLDALNLATLGIRATGKAIDILSEVLSKRCVNLKPLIDNVAFDGSDFDAAFRQARNAFEGYRTAAADASAPGSNAAGNNGKTAAPNSRAPTVPMPDFPPREVAEAKVAERALICHIKANEAYYREAIWKRLDPGDRLRFLSLLGEIPAYVDNEVLGFVGDRAAMPVRIDDQPQLKSWFKNNVLDNKALADARPPYTVTLPTRGVAMESRLGACDGCEDFIVEHRKLDLALVGAEVASAQERAKQEALETERYGQRLKQPSPLLDDPDPNEQSAIRVTLQKEGES
jgi:hypothetical protein